MMNTPQEWDRIRRIQQMVQRRKAGTIIPLGDDAFVTAAPTQPLVMAQDMMVEDVHFRLAYASAQDLGHKALAVNLSDFAAMGATPRWAQVSLALPPNLNESWLDEFYQSMTALADLHGVEIVGGDLCASPKALVIDVSLCGEAAHAISRSGAQPGDLLYCSGPLGLSAAGLKILEEKSEGVKFETSGLPENSFAKLAVQKHLRPRPRLDLLKDLRRHAPQIHALIDISDGLVSESLHLARGLEIGVDLFTEKIQALSPQVDLPLSLWGGEDYELLMAIPPELASGPDQEWLASWQRIGQFNQTKQIGLISADESREVIKDFAGWKHFRPVST